MHVVSALLSIWNTKRSLLKIIGSFRILRSTIIDRIILLHITVEEILDRNS